MVQSAQTSENSHSFFNVSFTWYKSLTRAQLTYSSRSSSGLDTEARRRRWQRHAAASSSCIGHFMTVSHHCDVLKAVESFEISSVNGLDSKASSKTNKTKQKKIMKL
jgi:hypothetical protein